MISLTEFSVEQLEARDAEGNYHYKIFHHGKLVAKYWHDFRGDENSIRFVDGSSEESLPGRAGEFINGDGNGSLWLTQMGLDYLQRKLK